MHGLIVLGRSRQKMPQSIDIERLYFSDKTLGTKVNPDLKSGFKSKLRFNYGQINFGLRLKFGIKL